MPNGSRQKHGSMDRWVTGRRQIGTWSEFFRRYVDLTHSLTHSYVLVSVPKTFTWPAHHTRLSADKESMILTITRSQRLLCRASYHRVGPGPTSGANRFACLAVFLSNPPVALPRIEVRMNGSITIDTRSGEGIGLSGRSRTRFAIIVIAPV